MRSHDPKTAAFLATRSAIRAEVLIWIVARHRQTDAPEALGIWSGEEAMTLPVEGQARLYQGGGALIDLDPIPQAAGLGVRSLALRLAPFAPEVEQALRAHEPRLARVEIHRAFLDPETGALAGTLDREARLFTGLIDGVSFHTPEMPGDPGCTVTLVSEAIHLTRPLDYLRSDAARRAAWDGDRLFRHAAVAGPVSTWWGEKRRRPAGGA